MTRNAAENIFYKVKCIAIRGFIKCLSLWANAPIIFFYISVIVGKFPKKFSICIVDQDILRKIGQFEIDSWRIIIKKKEIS